MSLMLVDYCYKVHFCYIQVQENYWQSIGYIKIKNFVFRIDVFEKIFFLARQKLKKGPFLESADLMNPLGCNSNQLKDIMVFCGYEYITISDEKNLFLTSKKKETKKTIKNNLNKRINKKKNEDKTKIDPNSPFAILEKLL